MVNRLLVLPLLVVLAVAGLAAPSQADPVGAANTADTTFVTMFGNGDYIAGSGSWVWRGGDATVEVGGSVDGIVDVSVSGGGLAAGNDFTFNFAAAPGETLTSGFYADAERAAFRSEGHPGIDVYGSGRGCDSEGRFTVLDIAPDLSRLHIIYESHCDGDDPSVFGEIRYNVAGGDADLLVAPGQISWPGQTVTTTARTVPVTLVNTGTSPVTVSGASITEGSSAFKVVSNACTTIAVGANCKVGVSFKPSSVADFTGTLTITDSTAAGTHTVALAGSGTRADAEVVTMLGNGDYIAGTGSWVWRGGDANIRVTGSVDHTVNVSVDGGGLAQGTYFDLTFAAARNETLTTGFYGDAERTPFRSDGHPGIDVSGSGRGCNEVAGHFTVLDIAPDLSRLHIIYESHCEGGDASVFGEIRYHVPGADTDVLVAPGRIDWPDQDANTTARTVPVTLVNTGTSPLTVSGASVTDGSDVFKVVSNTCTTIAVGAICKVGVSFRPTSAADYTGTLTIADSTAAGTHTVGLTGTGVLAPPNVTLSASKSVYAYGQSVVLTAKLSGTYTSRTVTFYRQYSGGTRVPIATRDVDDSGKVTLTLPARENATFSVDWAEGEASDTASVKTAVRARMSVALVRYKRKSGSYHLYSLRSRIYVNALLQPGKANRCVYFGAQVKVSGTWRALASTGCVRTTTKGGAAAYLSYSRNLRDRPLRFRAVFKGDSKNASVVGAWRYAKYVR